MKLNNGRIVTSGEEPYFIAEVNTSHFGDIEIAQQLVQSAKETGCDCVKFQSWSAESLYSNTHYERNPIAKRFVQKFSLTPEEQQHLASFSNHKGISFASTPYSAKEVDFLLERCDVPFIKIASMEINNTPLLKYIGATKSAIVLSTGMADIEEIDGAVEALLSTNNSQLCIMHCVSIYPAENETINLNNILLLRERYPGIDIGYSDHTLGYEVPIASVALGAAIVEKHFTLDSKRIGMDNQMAMEPEDFKTMITQCKSAWKSLGSRTRQVSNDELTQRRNMRRSIVSARTIPKGKKIEYSDLAFKRPGDGYPPSQLNQVVGKIAKQDIGGDEVIYPSQIST